MGGTAIKADLSASCDARGPSVRVPQPDSSRQTFRLSRCPEVDCLRGLLSPAVLAAAEARADRIGTGADQVLIAQSWITEAEYVAAMRRHFGIGRDPLDALTRIAFLDGDQALLAAARVSMLRLAHGQEHIWAVAPRHLNMRLLCRMLAETPHLAARTRLVGASDLDAFARRHAADHIARQATHGLSDMRPDLSAAALPCRRLVTLFLALLACGLLAAWANAAAAIIVSALLATGFVAWMALRLACALLPVQQGPPAGRAAADHELPVYTVVAAVYREAATVHQLVAAIRAFAYPPEKLDIKIVVEADDDETRAALDALPPGPPVNVVVAPAAGPRTKPKALNAALPLARGLYTVVYDAEDRPEPDQLRKALAAFAAAGPDTGCIQARLTIDNTGDGWLTRLFTAEYAGQFDAFLPALAALGLPLPLGGSSNHFDTAMLHRIGAWDPYNVTEDADLGFRLARFGYRTGVIASSTYEEAPARFGPWLRQRTRWFKGWMQTWCVQMRKPLNLRLDLGWRGFATFHLIACGNVLAALLHPLFLLYLLSYGALGLPEAPLLRALAWLQGGIVSLGYITSVFLGLHGLRRRKLLAHGWALALMPAYWLLLSLAAWRAVHQLLFDPFTWEKTEHGVARTSRLADGKAPPPDDRQPAASRASLQR